MKQFNTALNSVGSVAAEGVLPVTAAYAAPPKKFPWKRSVAVLIGLACAVSLLCLLMFSPEGGRGLLAFSIAGSLLFLMKRSTTGAAGALFFLALLGGLRRWLIPVVGWSETDPLLLTIPVTAGAFLLTTRRTWDSTPLSRSLTLLIALMALEIVNPLQGGLMTGVAGILFYIAPLFWYYIGRQIGTPTLVRTTSRAVVVLASLGALYGLYQTYFGFNAAERMWVKISGYAALSVNGTIRAISFFTSSAEYALFLSIALVILWVAFMRGHRLALLPVPLLAVALFLESARGPIVGTLVSCVVVWAVQGRNYRDWVPRGLLALVIAIGGTYWSLQQVQQVHFSDQTAGLVSHQTSGLLNPLDQQHSTAVGHFGMAADGIARGFQNPLGMGLGATTQAGDKFGEGKLNSELDISNMFISLGFIGGLLYLVIIGMVLRSAFLYWQRTRSTHALLILAVLALLTGGWLNGGAYTAATLAWLFIGSLDRLQQPVERQKRLHKRSRGVAASPVRVLAGKRQ